MESGSQSARLPLGEDLIAGHVHARASTDTSGHTASPRVKRRLRSKTSLAEIERQERGRSRVPEVPRLRTLNQDPAEVPISEGSLVPAISPVSGVNRAHPYTPVGNAIGSSSFEMIPSATDRAASERGLSESMETVPILRSSFSPSIIQNPSQVMSPNLVAGSAPNATPSGSGVETDAGVQAILQQWEEVKTEHGTVARTFTQCAQAWPLADNVKLEGIMTRLSSITDQKCDAEKVQQAIAEVTVTLQQLQTMCSEGSCRSEVVVSRMDELSGETVNLRNRLEGLERRVGMEGQQHESVLRELRASHDQCFADVRFFVS